MVLPVPDRTTYVAGSARIDGREVTIDERGGDPFGFKRLTYVREASESKALNDLRGPFIVISASSGLRPGLPPPTVLMGPCTLVPTQLAPAGAAA